MANYIPFKKPNSQILYTPEMLDELEMCENDPVYFMKNFIKIQTEGGASLFKPYDYQIEMIESFNDYRNGIYLLGRQQGKCFLGDSKVKIRNKYTGEIIECTVEEFKNILSKK